MKKALIAALTLVFVSGLFAGPALSQEFPEHPHVLVLGAEFDEQGEPVGFRNCIDLAANQPLPLNSQHQHVHFGTAGEALFEHAGHVVAPTAPFPDPEEPLPWSNCAELIDFFFGG
jgi:hypothetical protein